eukprot:511421_1
MGDTSSNCNPLSIEKKYDVVDDDVQHANGNKLQEEDEKIYAAKGDTTTMEQNATHIKSQRQERIEINKLQEEDEKDQNTIFAALERMRERGITDTKQFTWQLVYNENDEVDDDVQHANGNKLREEDEKIYAAKGDTTTMEQNTTHIKSQREERIEINKLQEEDEKIYAAKGDTTTMEQNATHIKSQRQERIEINKLQEEDEKDQNTIFAALERMRERGITDTKQFTWQLVYNENDEVDDDV